MALPAVRPFYNEAGELQAVFAVDLSLLSISQFLNTLEIGDSGEVFIMERDGMLVSSSTNDLPFRETADGQERLPTGESSSALIRSTVTFLDEKFSNFSLISREQQLSFVTARQRQLVQVTPYRDRYGLDWLIVVVVPESDFMAQIHQNRRTTIQLCLVALAVASVSGIFTARWLTHPILSVNQAARDIAAGQLDRQVRVAGIRELHDLAGSFNSMAYQLRKSFATLAAKNADLEQARTALTAANEQLEDKVEERTAQLLHANAEIAGLNQRLEAENLRMSTELEIAKRLQVVVLPRDRELEQIDGLEIAGWMDPADE
ncbi:MAG: HAMP domain-containing protein, partial [Spirulinaceae cyanobacterium RM2_2_10]|nr:HAMP domain-containing protein [Spirulinaceae cyanobacterium RM2_2_10]